MDLKSRWNSESTEVGKILHKWVGPILSLLAIIGGLGEYFAVLPTMISDIIPMWMKYTVLGAGVLTYIVGKSTVKQVEKKDGQV